MPVYYSYKIGFYFEAYIWFILGVLSLVYHSVFEFDTIEHTKTNEMISYTDHVMAYTSVSSVIHTIFVKQKEVRHIMIVNTILTEIMFNYVTINSIEHLVTTITIAFILSFSYNLFKYNSIFEDDDQVFIKRHFVIGFVLNVIEGVFFYVLCPKYPDSYGLLHGSHHVLGFTAIYYYMRSLNCTKYKTSKKLGNSESKKKYITDGKTVDGKLDEEQGVGRERKDSDANIQELHINKQTNESKQITIITDSPTMVNRFIRSKDKEGSKSKKDITLHIQECNSIDSNLSEKNSLEPFLSS
jgi:hypothetical protein